MKFKNTHIFIILAFIAITCTSPNHFVEAQSALQNDVVIQQPDADKAYLNRATMNAFDQRCAVLSPSERLALISGKMIARTTLLRIRFAQDRLVQLQQNAEKMANSLKCDAPAMSRDIAKLKESFLAFAQTLHQEYPGPEQVWLASRAPHDRWKVMQRQVLAWADIQLGLQILNPTYTIQDSPQSSRGNNIIYPSNSAKNPAQNRSETGQNGAIQARNGSDFIRFIPDFTLVLSVKFRDDVPAPSSARIYIRDSRRVPEPWLGSLFDPNIASPPPRAMTQVALASQRQISRMRDGRLETSFAFTNAARDQLLSLDPREYIEIEVIPSPRITRQAPYRIVIEVGDIMAATLFASIPVS